MMLQTQCFLNSWKSTHFWLLCGQLALSLSATWIYVCSSVILYVLDFLFTRTISPWASCIPRTSTITDLKRLCYDFSFLKTLSTQYHLGTRDNIYPSLNAHHLKVPRKCHYSIFWIGPCQQDSGWSNFPELTFSNSCHKIRRDHYIINFMCISFLFFTDYEIVTSW